MTTSISDPVILLEVQDWLCEKPDFKELRIFKLRYLMKWGIMPLDVLDRVTRGELTMADALGGAKE
jgi:hypothetical protein